MKGTPVFLIDRKEKYLEQRLAASVEDNKRVTRDISQSEFALNEAREARGKYTAPVCGAEGAAVQLGDLQGEVLGQLPTQPNERLVYRCETRE